MTLQAMVQAVGLTRRFGARTAVDGLNLAIHPGEIFGLVGPDGAGKTTTLRMLCGLMEPTGGRAVVAGHDVARATDAVKDKIGYMAQRFGLYQDLSVRENMRFYAELFGIPRADLQNLSARLLRMTRMAPFEDRPAGKLSGGMKQKLALMCSLLHRPQVLFLDEPTNGVDPVSRRDFWAILYRLVRDGLTVVLATAYLDEAERCNRVGLMHEGRLVLCKSPAAVKASVQETFLEVRVPDLRAARDRLAALPGVVSVDPAGDALRLFLDTSRTSPQRLAGYLEDEGHRPVFYEEVDPSLEDVFIATIRKSRPPATIGAGN